MWHLLQDQVEAGFAIARVLLNEANLCTSSVNEHWRHVLSIGTCCRTFISSQPSYQARDSPMKASTNISSSPALKEGHGRPGVKTPDSLRALKIETAKAVRLGSFEPKK